MEALRFWIENLDPLPMQISSFVLMFLEGMGIPGVPGALPMMALVPHIASGAVTLEMAIFWGTLGNWLGSLAGYAVGRWGGHLLPSDWQEKMHSKQVTEAFERWGPLAVVISRTVGSLRTPVTLGAGALEYPLGPYVAYSLVGALVHVGVWQWLLWKFGETILHSFEEMGAKAIPVVILLAMIVWLFARWKRRQSDS